MSVLTVNPSAASLLSNTYFTKIIEQSIYKQTVKGTNRRKYNKKSILSEHTWKKGESDC
jgi:hypothetical protein